MSTYFLMTRHSTGGVRLDVMHRDLSEMDFSVVSRKFRQAFLFCLPGKGLEMNIYLEVDQRQMRRICPRLHNPTGEQVELALSSWNRYVNELLAMGMDCSAVLPDEHIYKRPAA